MGFKISIIGPLNVDLIIRGEAPCDIKELNKWSGASDVYCLTAGAAGYISQNLKKLGNEIRLVSSIGDDPFGIMIKDSLEKIGINTDFILIERETKSAIAIFILLFGNNKRPLTYRLPTHNGWPPQLDEACKKCIFNADILHSAGYLHFSNLWNDNFFNLIKEAKARGLLISMDPQFPLAPLKIPWIKVLKPLINYIDIFMVDENEAINIAGKNSVESAAEELINAGFKKIAIKLGAKGVFVKDKNTQQQIPAIPPKNFVDSIGAGDSFDAGFIQGLLEGKDIVNAARMGVKAATLSIEGVGGSSSFPTRADLII
ncbi:MAG: carbohydrate kinase family protein [Promethearchaeota archaeon]